MSTKQIMEIVSLCISLLVPIIGFVTALVKVIKDKNWNLLKSALCDFVIKAEELVGSTGEEKKNAVLQWAQEFCQKESIKFDADQVSGAIEKLIEVSKKVNKREIPDAQPQQAQPNLQTEKK